jgi:hypothetical protein|tara:strand:- start:189 stop:497 length:309 start_codon:yes stop_codon:yes gene_type:complete
MTEVDKNNINNWYLKPHYRTSEALVHELKKYDSVDVWDLHKTWLASGTNGNRPKTFKFDNKRWERIANKTSSRSKKTSDWTVYFKCFETQEVIYQKKSPFDR